MMAADWPTPAGNAGVWLAEPRAAARTSEAAARDKGASPGEEAAAVAGSPRGEGALSEPGLSWGQRAAQLRKSTRADPCVERLLSAWPCWLSQHDPHCAAPRTHITPAGSQPSQHQIPGLGTGQRETWGPERRTGPQHKVNRWLGGVIGWSCHMGETQVETSTLQNYSHRLTLFLEATLLSKYKWQYYNHYHSEKKKKVYFQLQRASISQPNFPRIPLYFKKCSK